MLGRTGPPPGPKDRTTLNVEPVPGPGSLEAALAPLRAHGIPIERIHSRPSRNHPERQIFFLDCAGHEKSPGFEAALGELRTAGLPIRTLGSYPVDRATVR